MAPSKGQVLRAAGAGRRGSTVRVWTGRDAVVWRGWMPWHDCRVIDQTERYDRFAAGYARWWAPVLAPAVHELLDHLEPRLGDASRLIDIGTGTGQLALAALGRWPQVSMVGVDASRGMAAVADAEADRVLDGAARIRFSTEIAFADALPFDDATFDAAVSSFVFQLVPSRARAFREARRVLRPNGVLAWVSWLLEDRVFEPDVILDDELDAVGIGAREDEGRPGDLPSVEGAAAEMRRAGFADVVSRLGRLEHPFSVDDYIAFMSEFDEQTLFEEMDPDVRKRLIGTLRRRLGRLSAEQMTMRFAIVFASGRRSR